MSIVDVLGGVNCGLVFFFGAALSVAIAGGCTSRREWVVLFALCPAFLVLQTLSWLMLGLDATKQLYPLLVHLPLLLVLVFCLKRPVSISLVSIFAAYLCCQLPRCGAIIAVIVTGSPLTGQIFYTLIIVIIFLFLLRYFVPSTRDTIAESRKAMLLFGTLPAIYYIYDYTIAMRRNLLYSDILSSTPVYSGSEIVSEVVPTVVGLLYMLYTTAYRKQLQQRTQAELSNSLMVGHLKQAEAEMASLRQSESESAIYRHDMRHHLSVIDGFLTAGESDKAQEYIAEVQAGIEAITPTRFCENELVNLICSSFAARAKHLNVRLEVEAALPDMQGIPDTELCALLSNGMENALNAVSTLSEDRRWISCFCGIRSGKLLVEIKNFYEGAITMRDGLPSSDVPGHGYGCRSIRTISQSCRGLCQFNAKNGIFTMRVALPVR